MLQIFTVQIPIPTVCLMYLAFPAKYIMSLMHLTNFWVPQSGLYSNSIQDSLFVLCAGVANDRKSAAILISNGSDTHKLSDVVLKNFLRDGNINIEILQINSTQELRQTKKIELSSKNPVLELNIPPLTVCLVKIGT